MYIYQSANDYIDKEIDKIIDSYYPCYYYPDYNYLMTIAENGIQYINEEIHTKYLLKTSNELTEEKIQKLFYTSATKNGILFTSILLQHPIFTIPSNIKQILIHVCRYGYYKIIKLFIDDSRIDMSLLADPKIVVPDYRGLLQHTILRFLVNPHSSTLSDFDKEKFESIDEVLYLLINYCPEFVNALKSNDIFIAINSCIITKRLVLFKQLIAIPKIENNVRIDGILDMLCVYTINSTRRKMITIMLNKKQAIKKYTLNDIKYMVHNHADLSGQDPIAFMLNIPTVVEKMNDIQTTINELTNYRENFTKTLFDNINMCEDVINIIVSYTRY
jgi:hypothetical protein